MSMKQRTKLLKPVVKELVARIPALQSHKDPHTVASQLVHSALGSISPERASLHDLPISAFTKLHHYSSREGYEFNFVSASERVNRMLGLPSNDCDAAAQATIDVLTKNRIGMNLVKLLLDPSYGEDGAEHFKHLLQSLKVSADGAFLRPPRTATLAIASGDLPRPDTSWKARFDSVGRSPIASFNVNLLERVREKKCYLWAFPPSQLEATSCALLDRCQGLGTDNPKTAELGMGFSIIEEAWQRKTHRTGKFHDQYTVFSPFWSYYERPKEKLGDGWRVGNIIQASLYEGATYLDVAPQLKWYLHQGITSLPRIQACLTCRTFYVPQHSARPEGMPATCSCTAN